MNEWIKQDNNEKDINTYLREHNSQNTFILKYLYTLNRYF